MDVKSMGDGFLPSAAVSGGRFKPHARMRGSKHHCWLSASLAMTMDEALEDDDRSRRRRENEPRWL